MGFFEGQIADTAVTETKIADGAVTAVKLDTDAVTTAKILDGSVTEAKLDAGTATKLNDLGVVYTPGTPGDWGGAPPTTVVAALDRLAAAYAATHAPVP